MLIRLLPVVAFFVLTSGAQVPKSLLGEWRVGKPYDSQNQPVGLDGKQDRKVRRVHVTLRQQEYVVCGKQVHIDHIDSEDFSSDQFTTRFNMNPTLLGFSSGTIHELSINRMAARGACGDFNDPGTSLYFQVHRRVVMQVANAYYPLEPVTRREAKK